MTNLGQSVVPSESLSYLVTVRGVTRDWVLLTGTPEDRDEVRGEGSESVKGECLEGIGVSSILKLIRDGNSGTGCWIAKTELLKLQKIGQFSDESAKKKSHKFSVDVLTYNRRHKGDNVRGSIIIVSVVFPYFVRDSLI